jgi:hypothetical protein
MEIKLAALIWLVWAAIMLGPCDFVWAANANQPSLDALERLSTLEGSWQVADSDGSLKITFEKTANDSVLLETWFVGENKHSLTAYHMDNERLIATHYCPQGNQPRLEMQPQLDSDQISFKQFDATNMKEATQSHQHTLGFDFSAMPTVLIRSEVYLENDIEDSDTLSLQRAD